MNVICNFSDFILILMLILFILFYKKGGFAKINIYALLAIILLYCLVFSPQIMRENFNDSCVCKNCVLSDTSSATSSAISGGDDTSSAISSAISGGDDTSSAISSAISGGDDTSSAISSAISGGDDTSSAISSAISGGDDTSSAISGGDDSEYSASNAPWQLKLAPACYHGTDYKFAVRISWVSDTALSNKNVTVTGTSESSGTSGTLLGGQLSNIPQDDATLTQLLGGGAGWADWFNYTCVVDCDEGDNYLDINGYKVLFKYPTTPSILFIGDLDMPHGVGDGDANSTDHFKTTIDAAGSGSFDIVLFGGDNFYTANPDLGFKFIYGNLGTTHWFYSKLVMAEMGNHDYDINGWDGRKMSENHMGKAITSISFGIDTWGMQGWQEAGSGAWWQNPAAWALESDGGCGDQSASGDCTQPALSPNTTFGCYYFSGGGTPIFVMTIDNSYKVSYILNGTTLSDDDVDGTSKLVNNINGAGPDYIIMSGHWSEDDARYGVEKMRVGCENAKNLFSPPAEILCNYNHDHTNSIVATSLFCTGGNGYEGGECPNSANCAPTLFNFDGDGGAPQLLGYDYKKEGFGNRMEGFGNRIEGFDGKYAHHYDDNVPKYCHDIHKDNLLKSTMNTFNEYWRCAHKHRGSKDKDKKCPQKNHPHFKCNIKDNHHHEPRGDQKRLLK